MIDTVHEFYIGPKNSVLEATPEILQAVFGGTYDKEKGVYTFPIQEYQQEKVWKVNVTEENNLVFEHPNGTSFTLLPYGLLTNRSLLLTVLHGKTVKLIKPEVDINQGVIIFEKVEF